MTSVRTADRTLTTPTEQMSFIDNMIVRYRKQALGGHKWEATLGHRPCWATKATRCSQKGSFQNSRAAIDILVRSH